MVNFNSTHLTFHQFLLLIIFVTAAVYRSKHVDSMHCMHMNLQWPWKHLQYEFELCFLPIRAQDVTLDLKDPQYPEQNLGSLELSVTVSPKEADVRDSVRKLLQLPSQTTFSLHLLLVQETCLPYCNHI